MAGTKSSEVFSAEEKAAMKQAAAERKAQAKAKDKREAGTKAVREAIEALEGSDRAIAERFYELVTQHAPDLVPKTYYGMPGFANADDKILVFLQPASKFKTRYGTVSFDDSAQLDDGPMWPVSFAVVEVTAEVEKRIRDAVRRAAPAA